MPACGQAVGCGVCDTPELWCGAAGLCARVRACAGAAESLYIHTYPPPANSCTTHPYPRAPSSPITNTNKPMLWETTSNHTPLPGLMETTRTSKATQQKKAETPKTKPCYSPTVSWQTGACYSTIPKPPSPPHRGQIPLLRFPIPASTHRSTEKGAGPVNRGNGHTGSLLANNRQSMAHPTHPRPKNIPSTTTSSSWVGFLKHPTLQIHEIRKALLIPIYSNGITQTLCDSMYHI